MRYDRLSAMVTLVFAAAYFAASYLGVRTKLRLLSQQVLPSAKRIYGLPKFRFYTVSDRIKQLLFSCQRGLGLPVLQPGSQFFLSPFDH